jgi:hypothetical protein
LRHTSTTEFALPSALSRIRTFQSPRLSLVVLIVGIGIQTFAQSRMAAGSAKVARERASLDSAIAAAMPMPGDTAESSTVRVRSLVSRKRDLEVEANTRQKPWFYLLLISSGVVIAAAVIGAQALLAHVRGEA